MSTFTEFNGPQGSNIRASDLLSLTQAYQNMLAQLQAHIAENPANNDVHTVRTFVNNLLADYTKLSDLVTRLNNYYTKIDADARFATKTELAQKANASAIPDITGKADKTELTAYVKKTELAAMTVITTIQSNITALQNALSGLNGVDTTFDWDGLIKATNMVADVIKANIFEAVFRQIPAYVGGSDDEGVYYVLCELTEKAGIALCRFNDDAAMSAVVDWSVQKVDPSTYKAALSVTCANVNLTGLKFLIVKGTDTSGVERFYLAARANDWTRTFTSTDGVGYHKTLQFAVTGINVLVDGDTFYHKPNSACTVIESCSAGNGFSASALATDKVRDTAGNNLISVKRTGSFIHLMLGDENTNSVQMKARPWLIGSDGSLSPFVTLKDLNVLDAVGTVTAWPKWEENGDMMVATDIPAFVLPCDGAEFDEEDYPELYALLGDNHTPVVDYHVIKAMSMIDVIEPPTPSTGDLADAIATIHETQVYNDASELPDDAPVGQWAIIRKEGFFLVYYKTDSGWVLKS